MGPAKYLILVAILVLISTSEILQVFGGGCFSACINDRDCTSSACPQCLKPPLGTNNRFCSFGAETADDKLLLLEDNIDQES